MKLAVLTPWPHQPSGISDYAFDLVLGLSGIGQQVTVYTDLDTGHTTRPAAVPVRCYRDFAREAGQYDCILFQMGNNPDFHSWMLPLVQRYSGVVHLHDVVLQHMIAANTFAAGNVSGYLDLIDKWYGQSVRDHVHELLHVKTHPWNTPIVTQIPLFEEVVQHADACIVHSDFARARILSAFPGKETFVVPQLYMLPGAPSPKASKTSVRVGVFGGVQPNRQVDVTLRALSDASRNGRTPVELIVVGAVEKVSAGIRRQAKELSHPFFSVSFEGRVDTDRFHTLLGGCDLVISLRYPTMGETSAVVMKTLQYCIPTIVTRIGWYAELPDVVRKLSPDEMPAELSALISDILATPNAIAEWRSSCQVYADCHLDFDQAIRGYRTFLDQVTGNKLVEWQLAERMLHSGLAEVDPLILESIVSRASVLFAR